jgi:hypothetical protein
MPDDRVWALFEAYQEAHAFELAEFDRYLRVFSTSDPLDRPEVTSIHRRRAGRGQRCGFAVAAAPAQAAAHHTWDVEPGTGTISAAVAAAASPGDTIRLEAGTYWDSVGIPMTLTIRGAVEWKTVIKPPRHPNAVCDTPASGSTPASVEGLCPFGALDAMGNPSLVRRNHRW